MKIRRSIQWIVAIVAMLIGFLLWHERQPVRRPKETSQSAANPAMGAKQDIVSIQPRHTNISDDKPFQDSPFIAPTPENKEDALRQRLAQLNDEEIFLFARVVDQFNSPVTTAAVLGIIQVNNGTRVGVDRIATTSDQNGYFTISGYKGKNLEIHIEKSGYVMAATNTSFVYSFLWPESQRFVPDPGKPVVIRMWKLQGVEPLVNIRKEYKFPFTDAPIFFDLIAGKVVATGGDVKITINRPDGIISQQHPQNWSIDFEVVAGGFIETSDQEYSVTFAAPENGYQNDGIFGNNNGPDLVEKTFFIRSRNGQVYSKVHLLFGINDTPDGLMDITFNGVSNTNSSRNWEGSIPQRQ